MRMTLNALNRFRLLRMLRNHRNGKSLAWMARVNGFYPVVLEYGRKDFTSADLTSITEEQTRAKRRNRQALRVLSLSASLDSHRFILYRTDSRQKTKANLRPHQNNDRASHNPDLSRQRLWSGVFVQSAEGNGPNNRERDSDRADGLAEVAACTGRVLLNPRKQQFGCGVVPRLNQALGWRRFRSFKRCCYWRHCQQESGARSMKQLRNLLAAYLAAGLFGVVFLNQATYQSSSGAQPYVKVISKWWLSASRNPGMRRSCIFRALLTMTHWNKYAT